MYVLSEEYGFVLHNFEMVFETMLQASYQYYLYLHPKIEFRVNFSIIYPDNNFKIIDLLSWIHHAGLAECLPENIFSHF